MVVLLTLLTTVYGIIRDPRTQTLGVRILAGYFSREWKTEVKVGEFGFSLNKGVLLKDILVRDQRDTVLFSTRTLAVQPDLTKLWRGSIHFRKISIEGGEFQLLTYPGDSLLNLQFIIDYFTSTDTVVKTSVQKGKPISITGTQLSIRDFRFHYQDGNEPPAPDGMDYANIDVRKIHLNISNFSVRGDTISANITSLTARERSGFELLSFSGEASVCSRFVKVRNLKVLTPRSELDLDFAMLYDRYAGFLDFLDQVTLVGDLRPSMLNLADIGYFAPEVKMMNDLVKIDGKLEGTVSNFTATGLMVAFGEGTVFKGDLLALGLPDIYKTYVDMDIHEFISSKRDIESFRIPADPETLALPAVIEKLGTFGVRGRFTGYWDDFTANAAVTTSTGNVTANLALKRLEPAGIFVYDGQVAGTSLNAGALLNRQDLLGRVSFHGTVNGRGLNLKQADVTMNLVVDSLQLNRYNYRKIAVNGTLADDRFDGSLSCRDPNLWLDFNGMADFHDTLPSFDFNALIHHAQLFKLHLLKRDSVEILSGEVLARFNGNSIDNITGMVRLDDVSYREGDSLLGMNRMLIRTSRDLRGDKSFHMESDYLNADITGVFSFKNLINSTGIFIHNYLASFNLQDSLIVKKEGAPQVMRFILEFGDTREVMGIFLPFLTIAQGSTLNGFFDTEQDIIRLEGNSPMVSVYGMDLINWYLEAESSSTELWLNTGCSRFLISKSEASDTLDIRLDTLKIATLVKRDTIHYDVGWVSPYGQSTVNGGVSFPDDGSIRIGQDRFNVLIQDDRWTMNPDNLVVIDSTGISLNHLAFLSEGQELIVNGKVSENPKDTILLLFDRLDISDADYFLGNSDINIDGILSGKLRLQNIYHDLGLYSDLKVENFRFNNESLGDALIGINYNNSTQRFDIDAKVIYTGNIGQNVPLSITGEYRLGEKPGFDFDILLRNLNLNMVEPFTTDVMSKLSGLVSGEVRLTGTPEKPELNGQLRLMRTDFKVGYLDVAYSLSDVVTIDVNKISMTNVSVFDSLGNKAIVNGNITHNYFRDFRIDLDISMKDFCAFRNTPAQNSIFYGNARASGNVRIYGPFDNISIDARATTGTNTHVVIPISLTEDVGQLNYIIFEDSGKDTLKGQPRSGLPVSSGGLSLNLNLAVLPNASVEVIMPDQLGNLKATGWGNLTMAMTPTTPFTINGSYLLDKGSFLLQLKNLLRLPFTINEGSQITWTGDPANADIQVSAIYRTKAPLSGLTSDVEVAKTRVTVDCLLRLKGKLLNPIYEFGMRLPNSEPSVRNLVFNAIDTSSQLEMSKQVLSVLMLNQFNPTIGNSPGIDVSGTSLSIITNQINSILSRMSSNVNVNVNYNPGGSTTNQEFDVGLSTQFLNDRLLIDGAFGMTSYRNSSSQQTNTIVGDINIEYILSKNKRWRVRVFNRTNTLDLLYNNSPYTQGLGLSYQRDFNSVRDLFTSDKKKKVKNEN